MCDICALIEDAIRQARAAGDARKLEVMERTREKHMRLTHPHNVVAVSPDAVVWPNGVRWKVME